MKLSKPGDLGGSWPSRFGIIESGFAAYAQCCADGINGGQTGLFDDDGGRWLEARACLSASRERCTASWHGNVAHAGLRRWCGPSGNGPAVDATGHREAHPQVHARGKHSAGGCGASLSSEAMATAN